MVYMYFALQLKFKFLMQTNLEYFQVNVANNIYFLCFSKEISGFAALKRTIRQVEKIQGEKRKGHIKKKKDVTISLKKTPNAWTAYLNKKLKEVSSN